MLLSGLLERMIRVGRLEVIDADGESHVFSGEPGPEVTVRLHDRALHHKLFFNPDLYLGEAYIDGTLTIEAGTLSALLDIVARNQRFARAHPLYFAHERLFPLAMWRYRAPLRDTSCDHFDCSCVWCRCGGPTLATGLA